jgi:hypothetical protein
MVVKRGVRSSRVLAVGLTTLAVAVAALITTGAAGRPGRAATPAPGGSCDGVARAYQLPGADRVAPAAWSDGGLTVPACGPIPNDGGPRTPVYPYPGALRTPGYQCVEFSERYLYYRYGLTMDRPTNGDQVAAHYAAAYPGRFMVVPNGTPDRAPVDGDVLSMSAAPGFDSPAGGHTAVVQASAVNAAGDGTVTIVEENAVPSGVQVLTVADWTVHYDGFPYLEWLTAAGLIVTSPALPAAEVSRGYSTTLTAAGAPGPYRWAVTAGSLPDGLALSASGVLSGTVSAASAGAGDAVRTWPFTVTATGATGAVAVASLELPVTGSPEVFSYDATTGSLRDARWTGTAWDFATIDGRGSTLPGHTSNDVGTASSAVEIGGQPMVFYADTTTGSLRLAWRSDGTWRFQTLDGPGSVLAGHTGDQVGGAVSAVLVAGQPQVYYYDATSGSVRYAWRAASRWQLETLDGPGSGLAQHTWHHVGSVLSALVAAGRPQVYYYDTSADSLHRAWWSGTRWQFLTVDGSASTLAGHTGDRVGSALSPTLSGGQPQVFYADATGQSIRQASLTASGWRFETLDGAGATGTGHTADHVGTAVSVTQLNSGTQVYYDDTTGGSLRHAWWNGSGWQFETLDGAGSVIAGHDSDHVGTAVGVTAMTTGLQVYYYDATRRSLRHAWWTSTGWHFEILDGPGSSLPGHTADLVGASVSVTLH